MAVAPGAQHQPSLSGDRLVWADNRDSPERDWVTYLQGMLENRLADEAGHVQLSPVDGFFG